MNELEKEVIENAIKAVKARHKALSLTPVPTDLIKEWDAAGKEMINSVLKLLKYRKENNGSN